MTARTTASTRWRQPRAAHMPANRPPRAAHLSASRPPGKPTSSTMQRDFRHALPVGS